MVKKKIEHEIIEKRSYLTEFVLRFIMGGIAFIFLFGFAFVMFTGLTVIIPVSQETYGMFTGALIIIMVWIIHVYVMPKDTELKTREVIHVIK